MMYSGYTYMSIFRNYTIGQDPFEQRISCIKELTLL